MLSHSLRAVAIEKLDDRLYAELHGFSICECEFSPGELALAGARQFTVLFPNGSCGPCTDTEDLAWEIAAYLQRNVANNWARVRRNGIEIVTSIYARPADRPLFDDCSDEDEKPIRPVERDCSPNTAAMAVARSTRLDRLQLQQEMTDKSLPAGRRDNMALLKKMLLPAITVVNPYGKK